MDSDEASSDERPHWLTVGLPGDFSLTPKSDLTYKLVEARRFEGQNCEQSLCNGALLRNCEFKDVTFARCDFEGTNFQGCVFRDSDFRNANIRSSWMTRCRFINCGFEDTYIADCTWTDCELIRNSFERAILNESTFSGCKLTENSFHKGSFTLDTFRGTTIERSTLGDCTFLNHLFVDCTFHSVKINAEAVGTCFGISEQDLQSFDLIYLGEEFYRSGEIPDVITALEAEFQRRRWYLSLAIVHINFGRKPLVVAINEYAQALSLPATNELPLKKDDAVFFRLVLRELAQQRRLPGFSCIRIIESVEKTLADTSLPTSSRDVLRSVALEAKDLLQNLLVEYEEESLWSAPTVGLDAPTVAQFTFEAEPSIRLTDVLDIAAIHSGLVTAGPSRTISQRRGSYIEVVYSTLLTMGALRMLLFLLNGCIFQITETRARLEVLFAPRLAKPLKQRALSETQNPPKWMMGPMQTLVAALFKGLIPIDLNEKGIGPKNLRALQIDTETNGPEITRSEHHA